MRFNVPQFIDIEDKIFGPLTFRQFVYLAGGGGLVFITFKLLPFLVAVPIGILFGVLAAALAFYKVNDKPLINMIEAAFNYGINYKLYIWKNEKKEKTKEKAVDNITKQTQYLPRISESKLHDIAWGLDVLDKRPQ